MTPCIHIRTIAGLAVPRPEVFRAFDHLIALHHGALLLVPVGLVDGDITGVIDRCPVPWPEVWAVLDVPPVSPEALSPERLARLAPALAQALPPHGWVRDCVPAGERVPTLQRLTGPSGVRWASLPAR